MYDTDPVLRQGKLIGNILNTCFQIEKIEFFTFLDQGINYIYLAAFGYLLPHKTIHP